MKPLLSLLFTPLLLLACGCARSVPLEAGFPPDEDAVPWGKTVRVLRTRLVPLQSRFHLGEPMLFRLELRNEGTTTVGYHYDDDSPSCLEVTRPDGVRMPNIGGRISQTYVIGERIAPGETVALQDCIDASLLYFIEKPGRYELRFHGRNINVSRDSLPGEEYPGSGKDSGSFEEMIKHDLWIDLILHIPSNTLQIQVLPGSPLPPAYLVAGRIGMEAPKGWHVMLDEAGGEGEPGKIYLFCAGNWIHVRLYGEPHRPGPGWESWGESPFGFVAVDIPIRAEGRWPELRKAFQRVLRSSRPVLRREGEEGLLVELYGAIRDEDVSRLADLVRNNPGLARKRFELDSNLKAGREETLLHVAVRLGLRELATLLLGHGAKIDALTRAGNTALLFAVKAGDLDTARFLVECGADVDLTGRSRRSPLGLAAVRGNAKMVRFLLEAGADVNGVSHGNPSNTPLGDAVMGGDLEVLRLLLEGGAKPGLKHNE